MEGSQADPLRLRPHGLSFEELKNLTEYLDRLLEDADASLAYYRDPVGGGFDHRVDPAKGPAKTSKASTATCVAFLQAAGKLSGKEWTNRAALRNSLVDGKWESAELREDNPFTSSFLLEAIHALGGFDRLSSGRTKKVKGKIRMLNEMLVENKGGVSIAPHPPTAFLTYKVVHALNQWDELTDDAHECVKDWAWRHLYEESILIAAGGPGSEIFERLRSSDREPNRAP